MRKTLLQLMISSLAGMMLLLTMGLDLGNGNSAPKTPEHSAGNEALSYVPSAPTPAPAPEPAHAAETDVPHASEASKASYRWAAAPNSIETPEAPEVSVYEVTAHRLNVRVEPGIASNIKHVVAQGDKLEVVRIEDNGWLALANGGYVNGKYAKRSGGVSVKSTQVAILSLELEAAKKPATKRSQAASERGSEVPAKPTSTVQSESGLTEAHIAAIFEGTALEGEGLEQAILDVEKEHGINAYFTIAVMKLESGHGKSRLAKDKNNLFGLNAVGSNPYKKAFSFETKGDSVKKFGDLIAKHYVDKGLTSIEKVAQKYCKANPKWPSLVKSIMKSDYKKTAALAGVKPAVRST